MGGRAKRSTLELYAPTGGTRRPRDAFRPCAVPCDVIAKPLGQRALSDKYRWRAEGTTLARMRAYVLES